MPQPRNKKKADPAPAPEPESTPNRVFTNYVVREIQDDVAGEVLHTLGEAQARSQRAAILQVLKDIGRPDDAGRFKAHPKVSDKTHNRKVKSVQQTLWEGDE